MIEFNKEVYAKDATEAWNKWWEKMSKPQEGEQQTSRDGDVHSEVINAITVIEDPTRSLVNSGIRKLANRYAIGEMIWYMSGNNNLSEIQKYTNNWNRMSDDGKTVNSNYGWCIKKKFGFDQWEFIRNMLFKDPNSRQAVIHIKTADSKPSRDVNCTVCLQFLIRNNKLYLTTYMRSNDLWMGFPYDVFQFMNMQVLMAMELGVELGSYTHIAGSLHLYTRDFRKAMQDKSVTEQTYKLQAGSSPV